MADPGAVDAAIDACTEDAFAFLERLVRVESVRGQETEALDVLGGELARLGFAVSTVPITAAVLAEDDAGVALDEAPGGYCVVARRGDHDRAGARSLLINGHLDIVPAGPRHLWATEPFEPVRDGGWMYGRGAGDMKAGMAMATLALDALGRTDERAADWPLTVVGVIEEESTGNGTLATLLDGVTADAALLAEPTGLELWTGSVGVIWLDVTTHGLATHAMSTEQGVSAIKSLWAITTAIEEYAAGLERESAAEGRGERFAVNVGIVDAGFWQTVVPSEATMTVRVGFPSSWDPSRAEDELRAVIAGVASEDAWMAAHPPEVRCRGMRAKGYDLPADDAFAHAVAEAHADVHGAVPPTHFASGTTDARFYRNRAAIPALCYGPRVRNIHGADEAVELSSIVDGARTLTRLLPRWLDA